MNYNFVIRVRDFVTTVLLHVINRRSYNYYCGQRGYFICKLEDIFYSL
jgi:hypothetical protein